MALYGSYMLRVLVIAALALCVPSVRRVARRSNHGGKVAVLWPLSSPRSDSEPPLEVTSTLPASAPVLWRDWPRCGIRRTWLKVVRSQTVCLESSAPLLPPRTEAPAEKILTRAERAHWRLSWEQRVARNARPADAPRLIVTLHGLPTTFASSFGFDLLATA
jgi:hypothetical protein